MKGNDIRRFDYVNMAYQGVALLYKGAAFLWKYLPNIKEIYVNLIIKAAVETVFAPFVEFLIKSGDPNTPAVIRDVIMTPGIVINSLSNQEISSTGIAYDSFSIIGTTSRGACRTTLLYLADTVEYFYNATVSHLNLNLTAPKDKYALAADVGNFVCDYGSLAANYLSKAKQLKIKDTLSKAITGLDDNQQAAIVAIFNYPDIKTTISRTTSTKLVSKIHEMPLKPEDFAKITTLENENWFSYTRTHFRYSVFKEIAPGAVIRSIIGYNVGKLIAEGKKLDIVTKPYYFIDGQKNKLISKAFNISELNSDDKLWPQISQVHQEINEPKAYLLDSILLLSGAAYRFGVEIFIAPFQITPVRAGYAIVEKYPILTSALIVACVAYSSRDKLQEYGHNIANKYNNFFESSNEQQCLGENCLVDNHVD